MVVVYANPPCSYCKTFESSVGGSSEVKKWAASRGYMMVFALGKSNNASYGLSGGDGSAAYSFAKGGVLSAFPFVGVWWPKKSGGEVKANFTGRSGSMPVKSGSLARQFMDSVDQLVGAYASVAPKLSTVTFSANGGSGLSESSRYVATGKSLGALPTAKRTNYLLDGWFTAETGGTQVSSSTKITGNITLYAQWKKAVKLDLVASPSGAGTLSGDGSYPEGKKVSVSAKAKSGYVFSCWKQGTTVLSQSATYTHALGSTATKLTAYFVSKAQDLSSVKLSVGGVAQNAAKVVTNTVPQGVRLEWPVAASALTSATPSASGLPAGLKLVKAADGSYAISGVPTTASKVDSKTGLAKPSVATFKVKTAAGNTVPYKLAIVVAARPQWATGTFNGAMFDGGRPVGLVSTLSIAANGKISGKLLTGGKTWTLSAASFSSMVVGSKNVTNFLATVVGKSGKETITNDIEIVAEAMPAAASSANPPCRGVVKTPEPSNSQTFELSCWQNLWKTEPWKTDAKKLAKAKPLPVDEVSLKFASSGAVTAKGVFVTGYNEARKRDITYSASCSTVLIPMPQSPQPFHAFIYFAPKAGKFDGYCDRLRLNWDGAEFSY